MDLFRLGFTVGENLLKKEQKDKKCLQSGVHEYWLSRVSKLLHMPQLNFEVNQI